ncbi:acyl-CoA dehydrogenase [Cellulomonas sp. ACRRI]|uniref:acyl-CoA dehydrogenase n=1 Tax=Cellulomonas sp. ACRRI TaxID=2918188 RepID=UPI001EF35091|nr:acyl-CoA dehydrogenase [Cellulomonas sp. ACRRI]MCG7286485.1 acyl-CoA dehydrogenase [Cellulomonas sp. ACRRI]
MPDGTRPVRLRDGSPPPDLLLAPLPGTVPEALRAVATWPDDLRPGTGATAGLWELLATLAAHDLAVARAVEPHLDARAVLDQAAGTVPGDPAASTWGVYAAEGPGPALTASPVAADGDDAGDGWLLDGTKPWCSLSRDLDAALVTARLAGDDTRRGLFAVDLRAPEVQPVDAPWPARGLAEIPSTPVRFDRARATLVAEGSWYLDRPGFWWGAIGVAACWFGGAVGVARRLHAHAADRPDDRLLAMHLGAVDERLSAARVLLADAATRVDASGAATRGGWDAEPEEARAAGRVLAKRVRATVARTCEDVLRLCGHALGPGPLTQEEAHAKRVADLEVYVRQQHAERDDASLGGLLAAGPAPW